MKVDTKELAPYLFVATGAIFGYGVMSDKVDKIEGLLKLSDDNMNDILVLKTQMNMLISPNMEIRPSKKVEFHEIRLNQIEKEVYEN